MGPEWPLLAGHGGQVQASQWLSATACPAQSAWLPWPVGMAALASLPGHHGAMRRQPGISGRMNAGVLGSTEMKKARALGKVRAFWVFCGQSGYACSLSDRILITWQLLGLRWSQLELALQPEHPLEHRPQRRLEGQLRQDRELR